MSGELTKLKIEAFSGPKYLTGDKIEGLVYEAMFNPTTFNRKLEIEYSDGQGFGTSKANKKYKKTVPQDYDLELLIDGTGASGPKKDVTEEIENFTKVCAQFNGDVHRPNYLMISWAKLTLKVVLISMDVSYTMFAKDGTPLRAKLTASFTQTVDDDLRSKEEKKSSPDLTHLRTVLEGDTLPLMATRIYGDPKYYMEVARVNDLKNFRNITPGEQLFFPPIEK